MRIPLLAGYFAVSPEVQHFPENRPCETASLDESGIAVENPHNIWTGTNIDGTAAINTCTDWTGGNGQLGSEITTDSGWTANIESGNCTLTGRMYCFEQVSSDLVNQRLSLDGDLLALTSPDGTDTVDLSKYLDDTDTDNQILSLSGDSLRLTSDDGTDTVDLSKYLDDTDTDNQALSLSGDDLRLTSDDGTDTVSLSSYRDNTDAQTLSLSSDDLTISGSGSTVSLADYIDDQDLADVLAKGNDAGNAKIVNLNTLETGALQVDTFFGCDAASAECVDTTNIEDDTILGNDITDQLYLLHVDCEGECTDFMTPQDGCDVIERLQDTSVELQLHSFSCLHGIESNTANGFVTCGIAGSDNTCRAFDLADSATLPCANKTDSDVTIVCMETDIPR